MYNQFSSIHMRLQQLDSAKRQRAPESLDIGKSFCQSSACAPPQQYHTLCLLRALHLVDACQMKAACPGLLPAGFRPAPMQAVGFLRDLLAPQTRGRE